MKEKFRTASNAFVYSREEQITTPKFTFFKIYPKQFGQHV